MKQRQDIQDGKILLLEHYNTKVGYILPAATAARSQPIRTIEVTVRNFRNDLKDCWSAIAPNGNLDCIWLTYHGEKVMALLSVKQYRKLQKIKDCTKIQ